MFSLSKVSLALMLGLGLAACGGSDDEQQPVIPEPPENQVPVISLENLTTEEKSDVSITADVTDDGTISSYSWQQTGGISVDLASSNENALSFVAPNVSTQEVLTFELTVVDNDGAEAKAEVEVTITQKLISLTINGLVTDSPIANADVAIHVGDQVVNVTADEQGYYNADITVDDDDTDQMLSIVAQGKEDQLIAKLKSYLGTVAALTAKAGDDAVLTADEAFSVNVTNYTTAKAAYVMQAVLGENQFSDEKLQQITNELNPDEVVKLAVAIKVAIDKAGAHPELALPEGVADTLALVENEQLRQAYVELVEQTSAYDEAAEEMFADENVVNKSFSEPANVYFDTFRNTYFTLGEDNQGTLYTFSSGLGFDYQVENGVINMNFGESGKLVFSGFSTMAVDGQNQNVYHENYAMERVYEPILVDGAIQMYNATFTTRVHYPNGEFPDSVESDTALVQMQSDESIYPVILNEEGSTEMTLPISHAMFPKENVITQVSDKYTFNLDGSGHIDYLDLSFTWQETEDGFGVGLNALQLTLESGSTIEFVKLSNTEQQQTYAMEGIKGDTNYFYIASGGVIAEEERFDKRSVPGIYVQGTDGTSINEFWWELWPSGKAYTVSTSDNNNDGQISEDELTVQYGDWSVDEEGVLSIKRWRYDSGNRLPGCFGEEPGCYLYNDRQWRVYGREGDIFHVMNYHNFDFNADGTFESIYIDNRTRNKSSTRPVPVELPKHNNLPDMAPISLSGLEDVSDYISTPIYGPALDYVLDGKSIFSVSLSESADIALALTDSDGTARMDASGTYEIFADNTIVIESEEMSRANFAVVEEVDDMLLATFSGHPSIYFTDNEKAKKLADDIYNRVSNKGIAELVDINLTMADKGQDGLLALSFLKIGSDNQVTVYADDSFSQAVESFAYTVDDDGALRLSDSTKIFIPLGNSQFNLAVTDDVQEGQLDANFLFTNTEMAKQFVTAVNQLDVDTQ